MTQTIEFYLMALNNNNKGTHPRHILRLELRKHNTDLYKFAISINEPPQKLAAIVKGKLQMDIPLSLKIEKKLSLEEGYFMILQVYYDIAQEKKKNVEILKTEKSNSKLAANTPNTIKTNKIASLKRLDQEKKDYLNKIEKVFTDKKLFLKKGLVIRDVSKQTRIATHCISFVINSQLNFRFQDYVNLKRIQYFEENLNNPEWQNLSYEAMALRSGFKSRTTFFRFFIKHTGKSPSQYINEMEFATNKKKVL